MRKVNVEENTYYQDYIGLYSSHLSNCKSTDNFQDIRQQHSNLHKMRPHLKNFDELKNKYQTTIENIKMGTLVNSSAECVFNGVNVNQKEYESLVDLLNHNVNGLNELDKEIGKNFVKDQSADGLKERKNQLWKSFLTNSSHTHLKLDEVKEYLELNAQIQKMYREKSEKITENYDFIYKDGETPIASYHLFHMWYPMTIYIDSTVKQPEITDLNVQRLIMQQQQQQQKKKADVSKEKPKKKIIKKKVTSIVSETKSEEEEEEEIEEEDDSLEQLLKTHLASVIRKIYAENDVTNFSVKQFKELILNNSDYSKEYLDEHREEINQLLGHYNSNPQLIERKEQASKSKSIASLSSEHANAVEEPSQPVVETDMETLVKSDLSRVIKRVFEENDMSGLSFKQTKEIIGKMGGYSAEYMNDHKEDIKTLLTYYVNETLEKNRNQEMEQQRLEKEKVEKENIKIIKIPTATDTEEKKEKKTIIKKRCTATNPPPPCDEGMSEKTLENGLVCCYKDTAKTKKNVAAKKGGEHELGESIGNLYLKKTKKNVAHVNWNIELVGKEEKSKNQSQHYKMIQEELENNSLYSGMSEIDDSNIETIDL